MKAVRLRREQRVERRRSLDVYRVVSTGLFLRGARGVVTSRDTVIVILMSIERMLLAVNRQYVRWSAYLDDILGQVVSLLVLTVAAAEID